MQTDRPHDRMSYVEISADDVINSEKYGNLVNIKQTEEQDMNFASALISMQSGYKIRRKHWTGYWQLEDGEVFIYTYDGKKLNIRASENIMYTISNMACNDWEITR